MLAAFDYIDIYDGYQIIAEIWKQSLTHDTELIAASDFYTVGRTREPNMVTKGSGNNKREEQDGWIGAIVPNELIAKRLYSVELVEIENKKLRIAEMESELTELIEAAKVEDSDEYTALYDVLKKNDDGEAQDSFENKAIKAELKNRTKGTYEYDLLKKVEKLITDKSSLNKAVKTNEKELKEKIEERILVLTDNEINSLVYEKWFGTTVDLMIDLVTQPLKEELNTLEMLHNRYSQTLSAIELEIETLEKSFQSLLSELVVE